MGALKVAFLGSGNLATCLAAALEKAGIEISQVYSRSEDNAMAFSERFFCDWTTDISKLDSSAHVIISALKDSVAHDVWGKAEFGDRLVLHTAGSLPMSDLAPYTKNYGVLYPLQTLSKDKEIDFRSVPLFVEANSDDNLKIVKTLALHVSYVVMEATSEQRRSLHLAAVFACNFANHCYAVAEQILNKNNLPFDVLLPLIDETARKVHVLPPVQAQTGPAVRYDENVIGKHIELLGEGSQEAELYELISKSINTYSKGKLL